MPVGFVGPSKDSSITQFERRRTIDEWHIINVAQATHGLGLGLHHMHQLAPKFPYSYHPWWLCAFPNREGVERCGLLCPPHPKYALRERERHKTWSLNPSIAQHCTPRGFGWATHVYCKCYLLSQPEISQWHATLKTKPFSPSPNPSPEKHKTLIDIAFCVKRFVCSRINCKQ